MLHISFARYKKVNKKNAKFFVERIYIFCVHDNKNIICLILEIFMQNIFSELFAYNTCEGWYNSLKKMRFNLILNFFMLKKEEPKRKN